MPEQYPGPVISNNAIDVFSTSTEVDPQKLFLAKMETVRKWRNGDNEDKTISILANEQISR